MDTSLCPRNLSNFRGIEMPSVVEEPGYEHHCRAEKKQKTGWMEAILSNA